MGLWENRGWEEQRAVSTAAAARRGGRGDRWGWGLGEGLGAMPRGIRAVACNKTMTFR